MAIPMQNVVILDMACSIDMGVSLLCVADFGSATYGIMEAEILTSLL